MAQINQIVLPQNGFSYVDAPELGPSHGLNATSAKMYARFYGVQSVTRHKDAMDGMLGAVLDQAVGGLPDMARAKGLLVYCKTQTHNTRTDRNWLRGLADRHGLTGWDVHSLSMTSCASALVQLHVIQTFGDDQPIIILTGEKAFHPSVARLSVGLLAEMPTAAVLNTGAQGWQICGTTVRHLPRFHINPEAMSQGDRRALQDVYASALHGFLEDSLAQYRDALHPDMVFLPHNLNRPMTDSLIRHLGWEDRTMHGDLARTGHAYCSDPIINLDAFCRLDHPSPQVLILAAGTGVTFATCLLSRA